MPKFSDRVFGSNVDQTTIDIFENLQKGSFKTEALESSEPTHQDYIGDRTTFARMWTATLVTGSVHEGNQNPTPDTQRKELIYTIKQKK